MTAPKTDWTKLLLPAATAGLMAGAIGPLLSKALARENTKKVKFTIEVEP